MADPKSSKMPLVIGIVVGLLVAAVCLFSLRALPKNGDLRAEVRGLLLRFTGLAWVTPTHIVASTPDPPVVVRGGSLAGIGNYDWEAMDHNSNAYWTQLDFAPNKIDLDGIDPNPGATPMPVHYQTINLSGNWIITLTYRIGGPNKEDKNTSVQICSEISASEAACLVDNGPFTNKLYMVSGTNSSHKPAGNVSAKAIDRGKNSVVHFDPTTQCDDSDKGNHPWCDHPYNLTLTTTNGTTGPFLCVDGACDIGIGHQ